MPRCIASELVKSSSTGSIKFRGMLRLNGFGLEHLSQSAFHCRWDCRVTKANLTEDEEATDEAVDGTK
jgi:hypothetical protein